MTSSLRLPARSLFGCGRHPFGVQAAARTPPINQKNQRRINPLRRRRTPPRGPARRRAGAARHCAHTSTWLYGRARNVSVDRAALARPRGDCAPSGAPAKLEISQRVDDVLNLRHGRQYHRRDLRYSARKNPAREPRDRRSRHRQPRFSRHCVCDRQGVRHQAPARAVDARGQRRQGDDRAVLRPQEPVRPHRRPGCRQGSLSGLPSMRIEYFQLIDRIVDLDLDDRTIRVDAQVPNESTIFEGHFPGHPLMPGVLLIEAMAQASGWLVIAATKFERMPFLAAVKEAKLRSFVIPGQLLSITAKLLHDGSGFAMTKASVVVAGKPTCEAELTLRVMPFPDPRLRANMEEMAARIGFPAKALTHG